MHTEPNRISRPMTRFFFAIVLASDDVSVAKKLVAAGVDGITTNRPALLREQLR